MPKISDETMVETYAAIALLREERRT